MAHESSLAGFDPIKMQASTSLFAYSKKRSVLDNMEEESAGTLFSLFNLLVTLMKSRVHASLKGQRDQDKQKEMEQVSEREFPLQGLYL